MQSVVTDVDGLDEKTNRKAAFYTRQFIDAMSPANFMLTNPEVIESTLASNGENLLKGLQNFCQDFRFNSRLLVVRSSIHPFNVGPERGTFGR
jgi:polyhydroxyalkanoate synthase